MPNIIGQTLLNQFRVDSFVAAGGMASVYRVWDLKRNAPLAMKVLHSDLAEDRAMFRRFQREGRALQRLTHPNIVPFYGLYHTDDFDFMLEGFINGPTLKQILRRSAKPLPITEALTYLKAVSAALGYAHANGVVHCDVKPGNVMVDAGGSIYLADFGITRHAESTTTTLASAGTPAYMAPEQIRGEQVTPATDVYALGVMLFEMLTGRRPFRGTEAGTESSGATAGERIRYAHLHLSPPDLRSLNPQIPAGLAAVVLRALEKEPTRRYSDAPNMFAAACAAVGMDAGQVKERTYVGVEAEVSYPYSSPPPLTKHQPRLHRKRLGLWLVGGTALAIIILLFGFALNRPREVPLPTAISQNRTPSININSGNERSLTGSNLGGAASNTASTSIPTLTPQPIPTNSPTPLITATDVALSWQQGRLVYSLQTNEKTNERGLYLLDLAANYQPEPLLLTPNKRYMGEVWSPDGSRVAFYDQSDKDLLLIELMPGASPRSLTSGCSQPTWLPDGKTLLCKRSNGSTLLVDVDTGAVRNGPFSVPGMALPDWSPTGDGLLYSVNAQIFLAQTSGGPGTQISGQATENYAAAWSHDGRWIAYQSNLGSDYSEIWVMDRNGNNARQLTDSAKGFFARGPTWSPDDRWIAYVEGRGGTDWGDIYIIPVGGGEPIKVTHTNKRVYDWRVHWGP